MELNKHIGYIRTLFLMILMTILFFTCNFDLSFKEPGLKFKTSSNLRKSIARQLLNTSYLEKLN